LAKPRERSFPPRPCVATRFATHHRAAMTVLRGRRVSRAAGGRLLTCYSSYPEQRLHESRLHTRGNAAGDCRMFGRDYVIGGHVFVFPDDACALCIGGPRASAIGLPYRCSSSSGRTAPRRTSRRRASGRIPGGPVGMSLWCAARRGVVSDATFQFRRVRRLIGRPRGDGIPPSGGC